MTYLKKIETKIKLARGETVEKVLEFFTNEELLEMKDKKKITIKQSNKTKYRASDAVALKILVKNVPQLTVSIYELNLEKHYVNFNFDPSDSVDLSHIAPSACHIYATDILNPYHEKEVEIPLDLEKKQAVYIIDFQGEGVTSRAVIRKGGIICLEEVTVAGTKFNFHDETGKRLTKEDGLRLWVNGHNTTLGDNNSLTIGYKDENQDAKIVAALGSYATKFFRTIPGEEPALSVKALFTS